MKMIPILKCADMGAAIAFYTRVLDFQLKHPDEGPDDVVVNLVRGDAEMLLTSLPGDQKAAINVYVRATGVDALFERYVARGLVTADRPESPVHRGPLDQTWGMREFYVTDHDGNTLRFGEPIPA